MRACASKVRHYPDRQYLLNQIIAPLRQKNWTPIASIGNLVGFISDAATAATRRDNEALLAGRQDGAGLDVADYLRDG